MASVNSPPPVYFEAPRAPDLLRPMASQVRIATPSANAPQPGAAAGTDAFERNGASANPAFDDPSATQGADPGAGSLASTFEGASAHQALAALLPALTGLDARIADLRSIFGSSPLAQDNDLGGNDYEDPSAGNSGASDLGGNDYDDPSAGSSSSGVSSGGTDPKAQAGTDGGTGNDLGGNDYDDPNAGAATGSGQGAADAAPKTGGAGALDPGVKVRQGATDTQQGNKLGDCGLIAAINSVASSNPKLIEQNVTSLGADASGTQQYQVKLFVDGGWKNFQVPSPSNDDAKGLNGTDYGPIIEAAAGQALGGRDRLNGQWTQDMVHLLTGQTMHDNQGSAAQRDTLDAVARGAPGVCEGARPGIYDTRTGQQVGMPGGRVGAHQVELEAPHAYSVVAVTGQAPNRTVSLQNPHSQGEGSQGSFSLSEAAFVRLFGKSGYAQGGAASA